MNGIAYIGKLSPNHVCKSFTSGVTTCTCIVNCGDKLPQVKSFFEGEVDEFWKDPTHLEVHMDGPAIGKLFGEFLYPFCSFASQRAGYIFSISGQDMVFCLPTLRALLIVRVLCAICATVPWCHNGTWYAFGRSGQK